MSPRTVNMSGYAAVLLPDVSVHQSAAILSRVSPHWHPVPSLLFLPLPLGLSGTYTAKLTTLYTCLFTNHQPPLTADIFYYVFWQVPVFNFVEEL